MNPAPSPEGESTASIRSHRLARVLGFVVVGLVLLPITLWAAAALYFDVPVPWLRWPLAVVYLMAMLSLWIWVKSREFSAGLTAAGFLLVLAWWSRIDPSHDRDWRPDVAQLPFAEINGDTVAVRHIRNCEYRSEADFDVRNYDRTLDLTKLRTADLFMVYRGSRHFAQSMMSFGFEDGEHLCFSIEARREKGEEFSWIKGLFRQFERICVVADERDLVHLRTGVRNGEEAYIYRLKSPPERLRRHFLEYLGQMNRLHERPEWYNAVIDPLMTGIRMQKAATTGPSWDWRTLVNGHGHERLYDLGLISTNLPLAEVQERGHINERSRAADRSFYFSRRIRAGVPGIDL